MVRRMSPYERRRRGNARRSGGTHRSRAGNTTPGQRDSGHLAVPSDIPDSEPEYVSLRSRDYPASKPFTRGACESALKPLTKPGRLAGHQPRSEPDSGKPTVRDRRGLLGTVADGGIRNPCRRPKGRPWSLFAFLCARPGSTRQGVPEWTPRAREPSPRLRARSDVPVTRPTICLGFGPCARTRW